MNTGNDLSLYMMSGMVSGGRGSRGLLNTRAEEYWTASRYDGSGVLKGALGRHNGVLGSMVGVDSGDPSFLEPIDGKPYLYCPGVGGNYADHSVQIILTNFPVLRVEARVFHSTWRPDIFEGIVGGDSTHNCVVLMSDGTLRVTLVFPGPVSRNPLSTAAIPAGSATRWIAYEFVAATGTIRFFWSETDTNDPTQVVWTQLGADVAVGNSGDRFLASRPVVAQANTTGSNPFTGNSFRARWLNNGASVIDIDFTRADLYNSTHTQITALTGQTVTLNRSASGRKLSVVERKKMLFGFDDFIEFADAVGLNFGVGESYSLLVAFRKFGNSDSVLIAKKLTSAADAGYYLRWAASIQGHNADGVNQATAIHSVSPTGGLQMLSSVFNRTTALEKLYLDGAQLTGQASSQVSIAGVGSLTNTNKFRIGATPNNVLFSDIELYGAAIFRVGLTDAEILQAGQELLAA